MGHDKLFKSIYDNYDGYVLAVNKVLGHSNYIFAEDIVSDCVLKLSNMLHSGIITVEDVVYLGSTSINHSFFNRMVVNRALDVLKSKRSNQLGEEFIPAVEAEIADVPFLDSVDKVGYISEKLDEFSLICTENKFHADIFRYIYIDGISALQLSKDTGVPRYTIQQSKHYIKDLVVKWLQEADKTNKIMKVRAIEGINEAGDSVIFPSFNAAAKQGFNNVKKSMGNNRPVKGYTFSFIGDTPESIRTVEDSLKEESTGLGDSIAKIIDKVVPKAVVEAAKKLIWKDGVCGCNERMEKLNRAVRYNKYRPRRYFTKAEYDSFVSMGVKSRYSALETKKIVELHSAIFAHTQPNVCGSCGGGAIIFRWVNELETLRKTMTDD